mmetsp:Transcript_26625/g.74420  ORF Transcript_26625/g.74420 Transcript_26625/m.74420 type:complete len:130 (-) Transcript_26625:1095-1484(-)
MNQSNGLAGSCAALSGCNKCLQSLDCVWCPTVMECVDGSFLGPTHSNTCDSHWRWYDCTELNGPLARAGVVIVLFMAFGVFIASLILYTVHCLRRRQDPYAASVLYNVSAEDTRAAWEGCHGDGRGTTD